MSILGGLLERVRMTVFRSREDLEMDEEIRYHIESAAKEYMAEGASADEAWRRAAVEFGGIEKYREQMRQGRRVVVLENALRDLRHAARSICRTPGLSAVIVLTIGLGIGIATATYTVARGVVLDPIPFPEAEELFSVSLLTESRYGIPTFDEFGVWAERSGSSLDLGAYTFGPRVIGSGSASVEAFSLLVSGGYFEVLRPEMRHGRSLVPSDANPGSPPAAVISARLHNSLFGGDADVVGRPLYMNGEAYTIVGILERGHEFPAPVDVWAPLRSNAVVQGGVNVIGRVTSGDSPSGALATLETIHRSYDAEAAEPTGGRVQILPLTGRDNAMMPIALLLLTIAIGSILVIGVANAAGLALTRSVARVHEVAIRASLGASRSRIAALVLMESLLLAGIAGVLGIVIGRVALEGIVRVIPGSISRQMLGWEQVGLDLNVLSFALILATIAGLCCGMAPLLSVLRRDLAGSLQQLQTRGTEGRRRSRLVRLLVVGEVSLAIGLVLTAAVIGRSLYGIVAVDPGFATANVLSVSWSTPPDSARTDAEARERNRRILEGVASLPGVTTVGLASDLPVSRPGFSVTRAYRLSGSPPDATDGRAEWRSVTPEYLTSLGIELLEGRLLSSADIAEAEPVALVSEAFARRHFDERTTPVGSQLEVSEELLTIVGVVRDLHAFRPGQPEVPTIYVPQAQQPTDRGYLIASLGSAPGDLSDSIRQEIWRVDSGIAVGEASMLQQVIEDLFDDQRLMFVLLAAYGATALLVTLISLTTVVGHLVTRKRREFGIRMALGALPREVLFGAMWSGVRPALLGMLFGVGLAWGASALLSSVLYGVEGMDPVVFGLLPLLLLLLVAVASYVPARRAALLNPAITLRD